MSQKGRHPFLCLLKQGTGLRVTDLIVSGLQWGMMGLSAIRSQMYPMYLQAEKAVTEISIPGKQFLFCTWSLPWYPLKVQLFHSCSVGVSVYSSRFAAGTEFTLPFVFDYKNYSPRGRKLPSSSKLKVTSLHLLGEKVQSNGFPAFPVEVRLLFYMHIPDEVLC